MKPPEARVNPERRAARQGAHDAFRIVQDALRQHVSDAHPEVGVVLDADGPEGCPRCRELSQREDAIREELRTI